jgi:hypothetical protein
MAMHDKIVGYIDALVKKFPWLGEALKILKDVMVAVVKLMIEPWELLWNMIKKIFELLGHAPAFILNMIGKGLAAVTGGKYDPITDTPNTATPDQAAAKATQATTNAATGADSFKGVPSDVVAAAKASEAKYGVPAAVTIAQWTLESGSGKHMPTGSNNPFGIKAKGNEPYVEAMTTEVVNGVTMHIMQRFRKFDSLSQAFDEHAKLLANSKAYKKAQANTGDVNAYADALTGVYATDPNYGAKLKKIMASQGIGTPDVESGKSAIAMANANPMNTTNSNAISNSKNSSRGDTNVDVGGVTVHTQSTDPEAVNRAVGMHLQGHIKDAVDQYDDGVAI